MIYDCFTFFDEFDLLELRLRILDGVVDRFVLCEAPFTFRGARKPLYFQEAAERFAPWRDRITPLVYDRQPSTDPWENEWGQRDFLVRGLSGCAPEDLILIGDCDEIPDPRNVPLRPKTLPILAHRQLFSIGYVNRVSDVEWIGTRSIFMGEIQRYGTLSAVRREPITQTEVVAGGWHFSSFGGARTMHRKRLADSHVEYGIPYYADPYRLEAHLAAETDARWVALDEAFPSLLRENGRWSEYVWPKPAETDPAALEALEHAHGCLAYLPADVEDVAIFTRERDVWEAAVAARFAGRLHEIVDDPAALFARRHDWFVIDGLERLGPQVFDRLRCSGAGMVAYARNARSIETYRRVLDGLAFDAGRALGIEEIRTWLSREGEEPEISDRVESVDVSGFIWSKVPDRLNDLTVQRFRFGEITRAALSDFLARAFVFRFGPRGAA